MINENKGFLGREQWTTQTPISQVRLLSLLISGIFLAEVLAMVIIYFIKPGSFWIETLVDASIMTILILPILYHFHFRPLAVVTAERTQSENLLRGVLENLPVGVWIVDAKGAILHGNQASQKIWAGARYGGVEKYCEYKAWRLDSSKPVETEEWAAARCLQLGESILDEELEIECFDGTHKFIINSATPIYENGSLRGAIVVNQDITQRKQAEQALAKSETLFKTAFNILPVGAWITDEAGKIMFGNPAGHQIWAGARYVGIEEFGEYKAWRLDTGQPVAADDWAVSRAVRNGETSLNEELEIECFDGTHKFILNSAIPVCDEQGKTYGVFVINQDITAHKRAEQLLERQNQALTELSNAESKQRQLAEGLLQSILSLNASLELREVLVSILDQIQRSIPFELANIVLIENSSLRVVHHLNQSGNPANLDTSEKLYELKAYPVVEQVCRSGQAVLVEDTSLAPAYAIPGMSWLRSYLGVPLIVSEQVIGMINLTCQKAGAYNQETSQRLMAFAAPAALAMEHARLYTAELKARHLAETLNAASLALTQTLKFDTVMNTLLEYVLQLVPADRAYVVTSEDETHLTLLARRGYEHEDKLLRSLNFTFDIENKPYLHQVIASQKSLLIPDTRQFAGWSDLISQEPILSWLGIPFMIGNEAIGVLALAKTSANFFTPEHTWLTEVIVAQASVAIQNAWLFEQVRAGHERLQSLSRRLVEVQESERRYIARELHDEASQSLTAIMFGLKLLEQDLHQPQNIPARLAELKQLTNSVLEELHRLAMGLRPASLDYLGLVEAIEQLVKSMDGRSGLSIHFKVINFPEELRLPNHVETTVYRIVQEALTNTLRHAQAKNVDIILEYQNRKIIIMIEDNGVGFDASRAPKSGHLGLLGMQERAQMVSGTLHIESDTGCGTTIVLEVPYDDSNLDR
ncbi:MAG: GAF domain-containing protein [Anaerolineales bacterium]|nr:GAF domain-containing protein [Anaerolineales bacterium]